MVIHDLLTRVTYNHGMAVGKIIGLSIDDLLKVRLTNTAPI